MKERTSTAEHRAALPALLFACLLMLCSGSLQAQQVKAGDADSSVRKTFGFIRYLTGREQHGEALFLLDRLERDPSFPVSWNDSLYFLQGWSHYARKELGESAEKFLKVGLTSSQYLKARFFAAYDHLFLGERESASALLRETQVPAPLSDSMGELTAELRALELAGIALLNRDYESFREQSAGFSYRYYSLVKEQHNMIRYCTLLEGYRPRSPWKAGLLSTLVPGSGKVYSRKTGEGVAAFLVVASLGLITWENWRLDGPANWKTLTAGGIFSVYYLGNILGSVYAAKRYNTAYLEAVDNRILLDLHLPLRDIFD